MCVSMSQRRFCACALVWVVFLAFLGTAVAHGASGDEIWQRTYGGASGGRDHATTAAVDAAGNYYVTGSSYRAGTGMDVLTIKYAPWGAVRWIRRYTGPGLRDDSGYDVAVDAAGNVYVTGRRTLATGPGFITIKYSAAGVQRWITGYDGPGMGENHGDKVLAAAGGQVYVAGESWTAVGAQDVLIFKYTAAGRRIWARRYNGPAGGEDFFTDMARDGSDSIYLSGSAFVAGRGQDFLALSYDENGVQQWERRLSGGAHIDDSAEGIAVGGGRLGVAGYKTDGGGAGAQHVLVGYTTAGAWLSTTTGGVDGGVNDRSMDIALVGGKYFVAGTSGDEYFVDVEAADGSGGWTGYFDPAGPGGVSYDPHVAANAAGQVYVAGSFSSGIDPVGFTLTKFDSGGGQLWTKTKQSPTTCQAADLALGPADALYVTGSVWTADPSTEMTDYLTVKYRQ